MAHTLVAAITVALISGNVGTLVRHRGLALPYLVWLSAVGACGLLSRPRRGDAIAGCQSRLRYNQMSIVDDRGRLAGRWNLVDAIVAVVIIVLIPMAYGAYLLFRTPPPKLIGIEPNKLYAGPNLRIAINGQNLRPFMRVSFDTIQGRTFQIGSTKSAFVDLPDLGPGTYDVVLFDYMQEVDRLPKALTILPAASVSILDMEVGGSFKQLTDAQASQLKSGTGFPRPARSPRSSSIGPKVPGNVRVRAGDVTLVVPTAQIGRPRDTAAEVLAGQQPRRIGALHDVRTSPAGRRRARLGADPRGAAGVGQLSNQRGASGSDARNGSGAHSFRRDARTPDGDDGGRRR